MNTSPTGNGGSSLHDPWHYGVSNTSTDHLMTNSIHGDLNSNVGNVSDSYNNTINVGTDGESLRIQEWLSPLEPNKRHHDVRNRRLDGVGEWILRRSEFGSWCGSQDGSVNPTLLCYGAQGAGKTYISSLIIDTLREQTHEHNIAVLSLYCDYQTQKDQSAVNLIGGLLRPVASGAPRIPSEIKSAFEGSNRRGGQGLRLPDMVKLFVRATGSIELVYICVDAVDEVLREHRTEFLRALRQIIQDAPNVRLLLTGRPYIRGELDNYLTEGAYVIHTVADQGDIARYISQKISDDADQDPGLMTESLRNDIMKTMLERASDMFLLVVLNIEAILGETSLASRKKMLRKVATRGVGLDSVYSQTLQRIREQKGDRSRLGMEVLMWVSHAERPLGIDELRHALAIEMESTGLDPDNIRPQDTVLGSCLGLAVVDAETSTVRLIHHTLQEYLSQPGILPDAHKTLGETCLAFLNCKQVRELLASNVWNLGDIPFLEYSSLYWGCHAKAQLSDRGKSLALELLNWVGNHISATLLIKQVRSFHPCSLPHHLLPGLHYASYLGIVDVVAALILRQGCDINQSDCVGFTALMWAARRGDEGVVGLLLTGDNIDPDKPDNSGRTPLWWASFDGHQGVVELLLTRGDADPSKPDNSDRTPLWWASSHGHAGVVGLLLTEGDVDPDKPDDSGRTPLLRASENGHAGTVRLLLSQDGVNPNKPNIRGQTPLLRASAKGHKGVVMLLLSRGDVNPDRPDTEGQSPLWWASRYGRGGVVRLLLTQSDVDPNKPNNDFQTPLHIASIHQHEGVVALLQPRTTPVSVDYSQRAIFPHSPSPHMHVDPFRNSFHIATPSQYNSRPFPESL